jgi:hypothetical protein
MYYKKENGDTKGNEARDQWLFCTDKQVSAVLRNHPLMRNKPRFLKNGQAN